MEDLESLDPHWFAHLKRLKIIMAPLPKFNVIKPSYVGANGGNSKYFIPWSERQQLAGSQVPVIK